MYLDYNVSDASCEQTADGIIETNVNGGVLPYDYIWNNNDISENIYNLITGYYYVIITDSNNCELIQDSIFVSFNTNNTCFYAPTGFTPNGDGINATWQIDGIDLYPDARIRVFNRWGQLIYESEGDYTPWNGVDQIEIMDQEIATYYYVIDLNINDKNYNGSVTIKR